MKEFNFEKELLGVQDELFRFAYKLTANREKAEDLLQDTLLKAMLHKESYNKNTNFKGWLFIICAIYRISRKCDASLRSSAQIIWKMNAYTEDRASVKR